MRADIDFSIILSLCSYQVHIKSWTIGNTLTLMPIYLGYVCSRHYWCPVPGTHIPPLTHCSCEGLVIEMLTSSQLSTRSFSKQQRQVLMAHLQVWHQGARGSTHAGERCGL